MPTVAVNAPKTPVTKGSNGVATVTLPNICKMPGPPAPFVPVPLPNIGTSDNGPQGYSTSVTIEGNPVAIQGLSFLSKGDVAAMGTGGGIVSSNVRGPTTFIGPGSLDTKIEGKNVQLLGDPMLNNCGPPGSPANLATMLDVLQPPLIAQGLALEQEQEEAEKEEEHKYVPDWVVPALEVVGVAALGVATGVVIGAAIVAAAPEIAAAVLVLSAATTVFSLFSAPKESPDEA